MQAMRVTTQAGFLRTAHRTTPRRFVRAAAGSSDVPANVQEARDWIAAWKAKQQKGATGKPASSSSNGAGPSKSKSESLRAAAGSSDVPANVQEARDWIAAWKAKQQKGAAVKLASSSNNGAAPSKSKSEPPQGKLGPCKSFSDGTLLFTADSLAAVQYKDVKLKGN